VSVITNIGKEHTELLGSTIAEIAREKAGIIKKSIPVVVGERCEEYNAVIEAVAAEMKSQVIYAQDWFECKRCEDCDSMQHLLVTRMDDKKVFDVKLDLMGCYQPANVVTATAVVNYLHESSPLTISSRAFIEGLESVIESTHLAGRWQVLGEQPLMVCDTGHNSAGLKYVGEELSRMAKEYKRQICVMGVSGDKDVEAMLEQMPREAYYIFTQASIRRAMPAEELLAKAKAAGFEGEAVASVTEALAKAKQMAQAEDMIFVGGSNFVVVEIL
jgi:dihydrofolate synthase/folylpolyglutamate synthase